MEKAKLDIKYIDKRKMRRTMSNITHREDVVYQAHSEKQEGLIPYIKKSHYDLAIKAMKSGSKEVVNKTLMDLGE